MKRIFLFSVFLLIIASTSIYAHKGKTDKYGGHYDTSDGTYHYHSGKYADTGSYTAPVEKGGKKISDNKTEVTLNDKEEKKGSVAEDIINGTYKDIWTQEKENLEKQVKYKSDSIAKQNKEIQDYKTKIHKLEIQRIKIIAILITILIITNVISYKIGKNKN